jgi:hypothetical protein
LYRLSVSSGLEYPDYTEACCIRVGVDGCKRDRGPVGRNIGNRLEDYKVWTNDGEKVIRVREIFGKRKSM